MKIKLLLIALFLGLFAQAQIPTNGLVARYNFENRSINNSIDNAHLTKVNSAIIVDETDRFGNPNGAIKLNGAQLERLDIDFNTTTATPFFAKTISFWIKSSIKDSTLRTLYNDSDRTGISDTTYKGSFVYLLNGQVHATNRAERFLGGTNMSNGVTNVHQTDISDGDWHNIIIQTYATSANTQGQYRHVTFLFVDGVQSTGNAGFVTATYPTTSSEHAGDIKLYLNNSSGLRNNDGFDDLLIYNRLLSLAEIATISAKPKTIYVDHAAAGTNGGTSWADAYTDLQTALSNTNENDQIWIAKGTYTPDATNRAISFEVSKENVKIYGGFAGTETQVSQRDIANNPTILSGDLMNNDTFDTDSFATNILSTNAIDNSEIIVKINAENIFLDGFTIEGASSIVSGASSTYAILKEKTIANLSLRNCIIQKNVSLDGGAGITAEFELPTNTIGNLNIDNCKFSFNQSRWSSGLYTYTQTDTQVNINIRNSLFNQNIVQTFSAPVATLSAWGGSSIWLRTIGDNSNINLKFVNNTLTQNIDRGNLSGNSVDYYTTMGLTIEGNNSDIDTEIHNCIFYDNKARIPGSTNDVTAYNISNLNRQNTTFPTNISVTHSIGEGDFPNILTAKKINTNGNDPLFTDVANNDFTLQSTSPAINAGDNTQVIGSLDLAFNNRINGTNVDMGAFEYDGSLSTHLIDTKNNIRVTYQNNQLVFAGIELQKVQLYDMLGNVVFSKVVESDTMYTVENIPPGIYIVRLETKKASFKLLIH